MKEFISLGWEDGFCMLCEESDIKDCSGVGLRNLPPMGADFARVG